MVAAFVDCHSSAESFSAAQQDKNPSKTAADEFGRVATAYEVLNNSTLRADYDYALAHPKEYLYYQYRYYGSRIYREMKIPAHYTVTAVILLWSFIQYITKRQMYDNVGVSNAIM